MQRRGAEDPTGMDILLREVDGGYAVKVYTEKGEKLVEGWKVEGSRFAAQPVDPNRVAAGHPDSPLLIPTLPAQEAWPATFDSPFWAELSERCLSCRACAYVCPTCRCFDLRDETILRDEALRADNGAQEFERVRCWDSCAGPVYRRIAGGHNPRAAKAERLRNRFECKFYYYPEQYANAGRGPLACTGCGRCIEACPVNIDITEVLAHLAEVPR